MSTLVKILDDGSVEGYITTDQLSKKWNISDTLLRVWISRGKLKSLKIGTMHYFRKDIQKPSRKKRTNKKGDI